MVIIPRTNHRHPHITVPVSRDFGDLGVIAAVEHEERHHRPDMHVTCAASQLHAHSSSLYFAQWLEYCCHRSLVHHPLHLLPVLVAHVPRLVVFRVFGQVSNKNPCVWEITNCRSDIGWGEIDGDEGTTAVAVDGSAILTHYERRKNHTRLSVSLHVPPPEWTIQNVWY